ncbi:MAG: hypothetical protein WC373_07750 [Smithella sp.]|jgi:hypothetical protein
MWNSFAKLGRIRKALKYRGLDPEKLDIGDLFGDLAKRVPDKELNTFAWFFTHLEPPGCQMSHCKSYGASPSFCNCGAGKIPGRCKIYKEYLRRRKEKAVKAADELLSELKGYNKGKDALPLINTSLDSYRFYEMLLKANNKFTFLKKWNFTLKEDTWKEIKKRAIDYKANPKED